MTWTAYLPSNTDDYRAWAGEGPNAEAVYALAQIGYGDTMSALRDSVEAAVTAAEAPVDVETMAAEALGQYAPHLYDSDTADDLGIATALQMAASDYSDAKGENGHIEIDDEGNVCPTGSWDSQQPGARRVYAL